MSWSNHPTAISLSSSLTLFRRRTCFHFHRENSGQQCILLLPLTNPQIQLKCNRTPFLSVVDTVCPLHHSMSYRTEGLSACSRHPSAVRSLWGLAQLKRPALPKAMPPFQGSLHPVNDWWGYKGLAPWSQLQASVLPVVQAEVFVKPAMQINGSLLQFLLFHDWWTQGCSLINILHADLQVKLASQQIQPGRPSSPTPTPSACQRLRPRPHVFRSCFPLAFPRIHIVYSIMSSLSSVTSTSPSSSSPPPGNLNKYLQQKPSLTQSPLLAFVISSSSWYKLWD